MAERIRQDWHLHLYTSWRDEAWEKGPRDLATLTTRFLDRGLRVATITSFNDDRCERMLKTAADLPSGWAYAEEKRGATVTIPDGRKFSWVNSQEVPTTSGHVLLVGTKLGQPVTPYQSLETTLQQAGEEVIKIADHPLWVTEEIEHSGLGEETLRRNQHLFDAAELNANFHPPISDANKRLQYLCDKGSIRLHLVANSDAYAPTTPVLKLIPNFLILRNIGKTYSEYDGNDLDLTTINSLLYSSREALRSGRATPKLGKNNLLSIAHYIATAKGYPWIVKLPFVNLQHHCDKPEKSAP